MSKLTLDEAIKHCLEVAEGNDLAAGTYEILAENNHNAYEKLTAETNSSRCAECATEHRQLAEWLTELKQWRRVYGVCPSYEMCIPECKEGYDAQIAEYKRLLKAAVEDIHELLVERKDISIRNTGRGCMVCDYAANCNCCEICTVINELKNWRHADEALKLIGDEPNGI